MSSSQCQLSVRQTSLLTDSKDGNGKQFCQFAFSGCFFLSFYSGPFLIAEKRFHFQYGSVRFGWDQFCFGFFFSCLAWAKAVVTSLSSFMFLLLIVIAVVVFVRGFFVRCSFGTFKVDV